MHVDHLQCDLHRGCLQGSIERHLHRSRDQQSLFERTAQHGELNQTHCKLNLFTFYTKCWSYATKGFANCQVIALKVFFVVVKCR